MIVQVLPQDIIVEILLRLPVKSLIRFKCVSKSWFFLIDSSCFTRWHFNRVNDSISDKIIVLSHMHGGGYNLLSIGRDLKEDILESLEIDFPTIRGKKLAIECSCDGMLCLTIGDDTLVLWNPFIRVNKRFPLPPFKPSHPYSQVFGFGYDSSIGDYKVVRLHSFYCSVLTLTTNSWREIGEVPNGIAPRKMAISLNGGLYWQARRQETELILRFDLAGETFREVATPPQDLKRLFSDLYMLGHWKGSLCMYSDCALWVMKEEGELWSKMMVIVPLQNSFYDFPLQPLCFTKSGQVYLADLIQGELVMYDSKGENYKKFKIRDSRHWCDQSAVYTESLISPESGNRMKDKD